MYIITNILRPRKHTTHYTISESHGSQPEVGMVTVRGSLDQKWRFTTTDGNTTIPRKTHSRMRNGMRKAVEDYIENPYTMPVFAWPPREPLRLEDTQPDLGDIIPFPR
jgi:hypothetical protein